MRVDGGSDFERVCAARIFQEDLYNAPNLIPGHLQDVREQCQNAVALYNTFTPHMAIHGQTPRMCMPNPKRG